MHLVIFSASLVVSTRTATRAFERLSKMEPYVCGWHFSCFVGNQLGNFVVLSSYTDRQYLARW